MRNLPTRLLARPHGADSKRMGFGGGEMRGEEELREEVEVDAEDAAPTAISQLRDDLAPG